MNGFTPQIPPMINSMASAMPGSSREQRTSPSPAGWVFTAATVVFFALFAHSLVPVLDTFRQMMINPIETWGTPDTRVGRYIVLGPLVMLGSIAGFASMWRAGSLRTGMLLSNGAGVAGAGLGVLAGWTKWTPPVRIDPAWDVYALAGYWAPVWLPAVLFIVGGAMLIGAVASIVAARKRADERDSMRRAGHQVVGRIIDVVFTNTWIMGDPQFRVTVAYDTPHGPQQATRTLVVPAMSAPVKGTPITVLYDPTRPGRIELDYDTDRHSFGGWAAFLPQP